jgi:hypothetical protein
VRLEKQIENRERQRLRMKIEFVNSIPLGELNADPLWLVPYEENQAVIQGLHKGNTIKILFDL